MSELMVKNPNQSQKGNIYSNLIKTRHLVLDIVKKIMEENIVFRVVLTLIVFSVQNKINHVKNVGVQI